MKPTPDNTIYLSKDDWGAFIQALENPPKPNARLKALMSGKEYREPGLARHKYVPNTTSGIGFCEICHSDDENSYIHIK